MNHDTMTNGGNEKCQSPITPRELNDIPEGLLNNLLVIGVSIERFVMRKLADVYYT